VSRGLESARGFDLFMKAAKKIYQQVPETIFLIAGDERTNYGHELHHLPQGTTFKQWVLGQDSYELDRFHFFGLIPTAELSTLYSLSDLHVYLTVPYVLSWSMMQAMANECIILGSDTAPVQEVLDDNVNGLMEDFYDVDGLAERAVRVLRDPEEYRHLGRAARQRVLERYEKKLCIDQLVKLFKDVAGRSRSASVDEAFRALGQGQPR
jgi:glycosyltransferase involved in cell wall biosynthesis